MSRRSRAAVARSVGGDRWLATLVGLLLLAASVGAVLLGAGVFGYFRARRPVLDPLVAGWLDANAGYARLILVVAGIVLVVVGLAWALRSARPERRPDVLLEETAGESIVVTHAAVCEAVRADAEQVPGVARARVRMVGDDRRPALRMTLWLHEGSDVRDVWAEVDGRVLARARRAFDVSALPAAVRVELDAAAVESPRVT